MATLTQALRHHPDAPEEEIRALAKRMREEDGVLPELAAKLAVEELLDDLLDEAREFWDYVEKMGGARPKRPAQEIVSEQFGRFTSGG